MSTGIMKKKVQVRQHVLSVQHKLDRIKLSIQHGPLGSFDRVDGERVALLWNLTRHMTDSEIELALQDKCP